MLKNITDDLQSDEEYYARKRRYYETHKADVIELARELRLGDHLINATTDTDSIRIAVSGTFTELKEVFRVFRNLGYEPSSRPEDTKLSSFSTFFKHPAKSVEFYLNFSSTLCKRVQVGTKMVEQAIYETVCE